MLADKDQIDLFCRGLGHYVSLSVYWPAGLAYIGHDESSDHSSDVRPWPWPEATKFSPWPWSWALAFGCLGLGVAGQVLALALAGAVKLRYINSNI